MVIFYNFQYKLTVLHLNVSHLRAIQLNFTLRSSALLRDFQFTCASTGNCASIMRIPFNACFGMLRWRDGQLLVSKTRCIMQKLDFKTLKRGQQRSCFSFGASFFGTSFSKAVRFAHEIYSHQNEAPILVLTIDVRSSISILVDTRIFDVNYSLFNARSQSTIRTLLTRLLYSIWCFAPNGILVLHFVKYSYWSTSFVLVDTRTHSVLSSHEVLRTSCSRFVRMNPFGFMLTHVAR